MAGRAVAACLSVPELPEVETIRRQLEPLVVGRQLGRHGPFPIRSSPPRSIVGPTTSSTAAARQVPALGLDDDRELVVHLGMTGSLRVRPAGDDGDAYVRAVVGRPSGRGWRRLRRGGVEYRDVRRFGRLAWSRSVASTRGHPGGAGARRRSTRRSTRSTSGARSERSRRAVKTQLLSQRPIAGVGNIYADEALWRVGINPVRRTVTRAQAAALLDALRDVLPPASATAARR